VSGQRQDGSGRGNHLTDNNTVGSVSGQVGLAADFESDSLESLSNSDGSQSGLDITGSLTLVGWMKAEEVWRWQMMASKYEWGVTNRAYRFGLNSGNQLHFVVSPDGQYLDGHILNGWTALGAGEWHHVAAVFDAQTRTMALYLDGELDGIRTVVFDSINVSTAPFMLGANMSNGSVVQHFDGQLDEWRIYSRALSESEIESLMASPTW
jgi:beta-galactosidase